MKNKHKMSRQKHVHGVISRQPPLSSALQAAWRRSCQQTCSPTDDKCRTVALLLHQSPVSGSPPPPRLCRVRTASSVFCRECRLAISLPQLVSTNWRGAVGGGGERVGDTRSALICRRGPHPRPTRWRWWRWRWRWWWQRHRWRRRCGGGGDGGGDGGGGNGHR